MRLHRMNLHGLSVAEARTTPPGDDAGAPVPPAAELVHGGAQSEGTASGAAPASGDPLGGPAIAAEGLNELAADVPEAGTQKPAAGATQEVHGTQSREEYGRAFEAVVRQGDKVLSPLLGVEADKPEDLKHIVDMGRPGAELYGARLGPWFWLVMLVLGLGMWVAAKFARRNQQMARRASFAAPAAVDDSFQG